MQEAIVAKINELTGDTVRVEEVTVNKTNGVKRLGFTVIRDGVPYSPTVYVDDIPSDEIVDYVTKVYVASRNDADSFKDASEVLTRDTVLSTVYPVLLNRERNAELLDGLVHDSFYDLEVIYRVEVELTPDYTGEVNIK